MADRLHCLSQRRGMLSLNESFHAPSPSKDLLEQKVQLPEIPIFATGSCVVGTQRSQSKKRRGGEGEEEEEFRRIVAIVDRPLDANFRPIFFDENRIQCKRQNSPHPSRRMAPGPHQSRLTANAKRQRGPTGSIRSPKWIKRANRCLRILCTRK